GRHPARRRKRRPCSFIPSRPRPPPVLPSDTSPAPVDHLQAQPPGVVPKHRLDARPASVLEYVRRRLLEDPVGRKVQPSWQWSGSPLDADVDRQTSRAHSLDERVELAEPWLRGERGPARVISQHPQQPAQLGQRLPPASLYRPQRLADLFGVPVQILRAEPLCTTITL